MQLKNDRLMHSNKTIPLVSICCVTYNHENYIRQCLEGFVMQQTNFPFEVLVHEDASTDNTAKIVKEYEAKYPDLFRCVYQTENQFLKQNTLQNILFPMIRGKYVALCEGDDYWTDPLKLQKQSDFLSENPEYSVCFHAVNEKRDDKIEFSTHQPDVEKTFDIRDLAKGNFIHTPSVLFIKGLFEFPDWFFQVQAADYVIHMLNARKGLIKYFPEPMAVYRIHAQGIWNLQKYEYRLLNTIKTIDLMINEFDGNVKEILIKQNAGYYNSLAKIAYSERDVEKAKRYLEKAFFLDDSLKEEWLINYYPTMIFRLFNSRRYKASERFFNFINRVLFIGQRKKKQ